MKFKLLTLTAAALTMQLGASAKGLISIEELHDKIEGAWIGQMVGNFYGLPYENDFIEEAGAEENWPWGYAKSLEKLETYNGAFSDDDTDFEYLYLILMEEKGVEPTYQQICEAWKYHVRDRVWLANRATVGLMNYGYTPPYTGQKGINPHWFQIDPQLINEIWAYTAPGMTSYAAEKSLWAARITSDEWALSPTVLYGAIFAEAFLEDDVNKLLEKALTYLPEDDKYAIAVREMIALHKQYPNDWKKARDIMCQKYYTNEPEETKTIWNANLNGACGILALLYGQGDWQRSMDIGISMGFDADNQTATVGGILGVMKGTKDIPDTFLNPFNKWEKPFNNQYTNITRYDMPDGEIDDMINRTVKVAIEVACKNGGKIITKGGKEYLKVNTKAKFNAPLEFSIGPAARLEAGSYTKYDFANDDNRDCTWRVVSGSLPEGMTLNGSVMEGTPSEAGKYKVTLSMTRGKESAEHTFNLTVRGKNIAPVAKEILANISELNREQLYSCWITIPKTMYADKVNIINDGVLLGEGQTFYSLASESCLPKIDYFGYTWDDAHTIDMVAFHTGCLEEFGGWASNINIQYRGEDNKWHDVGNYSSTPSLPASDSVFIQAHNVEYLFNFEPVTTTAIRVLFDAKVEWHWNDDTEDTSAFTSITELSVYEK